MGKINWQRVMLGGLLWAVVYNVIMAACWFLFLKAAWLPALQAAGHPFEETLEFISTYLVLTLLAGIFALWLYAAIRPRYGPGPKTAACAGAAVWTIGVLLPTLSWNLLIHLPTQLIATNVGVNLVAMVAATLVGARPYKE
jgi:hypothetical protein